ncbi:glutamyl-queuosine tRNA(Asp) synthetase [Rubrobacter radiotolerans]|uniref:Glutamyl-Q tRNA(Asp) synthetase n=1 Tax=Rubrobacter radiotolerans TaxID=42256 RepID=A0A023X1C7_RUBRA|nr:tRNA glutamyl-Q(34) synthetase GluQRS [Rubrobacter radiotolerans]AHY45820.1 glutamyl-queuosine tRNA(Asp) synthetase [Rubrobacter radiotolerans]MDX5893234.1 tRNA glutamyl-Q(34) synthetase GluQRS [Rubrobacter radiotolerans]SMC03330.1 glutamyl-tRNA synthetase [Rubrobacter radiotolerans DSM 5868]
MDFREPQGDRTGRFAPSPTGVLHLGNLRTALLAWLFARSAGSRFLLRMEDLDNSRVRPGVEAEQLEDLRLLGLDHDGPVVRQSERLGLYREVLRGLEAKGLVYPCYCTRREIRAEVAASVSAPHGLSGALLYPGTCRNLSRKERAEREAAGRRPALRVRAAGPDGLPKVVRFTDRLLGAVEGRVDDFIVRRGDGAFAYQLAVVVDDAAQGVREVVRGADLADSTPRQVLLHDLLGLPLPAYAHVPLVLGPDGERLAKRHGSVNLRDRLKLGESPRDVLGWMARSLGLAEPGGSPTPRDLLRRFDPAKLPKEPTVWRPESETG